MEELGDRVMRLRMERGISQRQFAKLVGTSPGLISFIERNRNKPNFQIVGRMAKILDTTADYLIFGEEPLMESTEDLIEEIRAELFEDFDGEMISVSEKERELVKKFNILTRLANLTRTDLDIIIEIIERLEEVR
jgi:transcriptional regulator with XRE-family HTH domain